MLPGKGRSTRDVVERILPCSGRRSPGLEMPAKKKKKKAGAGAPTTPEQTEAVTVPAEAAAPPADVVQEQVTP
eukprot:3849594-Prymnesium_polylepis.1